MQLQLHHHSTNAILLRFLSTAAMTTKKRMKYQQNVENCGKMHSCVGRQPPIFKSTKPIKQSH